MPARRSLAPAKVETRLLSQEQQRDSQVKRATRGAVILCERLVGKWGAHHVDDARPVRAQAHPYAPTGRDLLGSSETIGSIGRTYPAPICPLARGCVGYGVAHCQVEGGAGRRPIWDMPEASDGEIHGVTKLNAGGGVDRALADGLARAHNGHRDTRRYVERERGRAAVASGGEQKPGEAEHRHHCDREHAVRARSRVVPRADGAQRHDLQQQHPAISTPQAGARHAAGRRPRPGRRQARTARAQGAGSGPEGLAPWPAISDRYSVRCRPNSSATRATAKKAISPHRRRSRKVAKSPRWRSRPLT